MYDKSISREKSILIKGISILLMLAHHLFAFPNRVNGSLYISFLKVQGVPIEYYIGIFSKICVSIFLFMSGYGLFISYYNKPVSIKSILKRVLKFYCIYWIIFIIFIPLGVVLKKIEINLKSLFLNFIGVSSSFNAEWWFVSIYIILLILSPIIINYIKHNKKIVTIIVSLFICSIGLILNKISVTSGNKILAGVLQWIGLFCSQQIYFIIGILIAKEMIFDKITNIFINININKKQTYYILLIISIIVFYLFMNMKIVSYFIFIGIMPMFILAVSNIIKENRILKLLGNNSTNMWLIHSFFCYYYFQELILLPKYSIFILMWLVIVSLAISIIINLLVNKSKKLFRIKFSNLYMDYFN